MGASKVAGVVGVVVFILAIVLVILLSVSFVGVHYYEYGFMRTLSTGEIDDSQVYSGGLYSLGPNKGFLTFPADAHFEALDGLSVATGDENSISIWVKFQYRLRKDELNLMREKYNTEYKPILKSAAIEALKQTTTKFSNRVFLRERKMVEDAFEAAIRSRLESTCCSATCPDSGFCKKGCVLSDSCSGTDRREHVELLDVQLTDLELPDNLIQKYMSNILLNVAEERTQFDKNVTIITKETEVLVNKIVIDTSELRRNATAQAQLVRARAIADAREVRERARIDGLKMLFDSVGITDPNDRNAVHYLRALKDMAQARLNINFDTLFRQN